MVFLSGFCLFLWEGAFFLVFVFPFPIKSRIFVKFLRHAVSGVSYSFCDEKLHNNIYYLIKSRKFIMKISRIDHLGIGVESIDAVLPYFENVLGLKCYAVEEVADQKVKTAFLKVGEVKLELLEPTSPESAVAKWLEKGGKGVHHVAFAVEDGVAEALVEAEGKGVRLIDKTPRPGAEQMMIGFLHPKTTAGILTEFCEPQNK